MKKMLLITFALVMTVSVFAAPPQHQYPPPNRPVSHPVGGHGGGDHGPGPAPAPQPQPRPDNHGGGGHGPGPNDHHDGHRNDGIRLATDIVRLVGASVETARILTQPQVIYTTGGYGVVEEYYIVP